MDNYLPPEQVNLPSTTIEKLNQYELILRKWNDRINLVGRSTIDDIHRRHFDDSLGILPLLPKNSCTIADFGTGAGFPGMVLAMATQHEVTLIESIQKKCVFLREVIIATQINCEVICDRIENVPPRKFDIITGRALASLDQLWIWAKPCLRLDGYVIFLKGNSDTLLQEIKTVHDNDHSVKITVSDHPYQKGKIVLMQQTI